LRGVYPDYFISGRHVEQQRDPDSFDIGALCETICGILIPPIAGQVRCKNQVLTLNLIPFKRPFSRKSGFE
jgi:hypothetical protein